MASPHPRSTMKLFSVPVSHIPSASGSFSSYRLSVPDHSQLPSLIPDSGFCLPHLGFQLSRAASQQQPPACTFHVSCMAHSIRHAPCWQDPHLQISRCLPPSLISFPFSLPILILQDEILLLVHNPLCLPVSLSRV